jgi:hypothetical protein
MFSATLFFFRDTNLDFTSMYTKKRLKTRQIKEHLNNLKE